MTKTKKPYLKIRAKFGRSTYREEYLSRDMESNPEWQPILAEIIGLYLRDEDTTSISIRRIK